MRFGSLVTTIKSIMIPRNSSYGKVRHNEGKSAANFCLQVAAWVSDVLSNLYLMKNHKNADYSTTTKAREK